MATLYPFFYDNMDNGHHNHIEDRGCACSFIYTDSKKFRDGSEYPGLRARQMFLIIKQMSVEHELRSRCEKIKNLIVRCGAVGITCVKEDFKAFEQISTWMDEFETDINSGVKDKIIWDCGYLREIHKKNKRINNV